MEAFDATIVGAGASRGPLARHLAPSGTRIVLGDNPLRVNRIGTGMAAAAAA